MTQEDRNHFLPCLQASSLCLSLLYGPLITDGHHLFFMSAPQRSSLFVYFYYSLSSTQLRYCQVKKKSTMWELWVKFYLAQETAFQIALRNCSKEVEGRSAYMWFGSRHHHEEMWCFSRHEKMQQLSSQNQFLKIYNYLKTCSANFFRARNASFLNSLQQILKASSCSSMCDLILVEVDRKCTWQVPTGS